LGITGGCTTIIPAFLGVADTAELALPDRMLIHEFRPLLVAVAGGEEDPERGLAIVLRAVEQLLPLIPGLGAVLLGWQVGPKTRPLIDELGLARHAVCLGEVSHERCLAFLRAADVVVRSTFVDGDAITVREALAFGVPVLASDTAFRPEEVTLFRKGDVSDLVARLRQVLAAPRAGSSPARTPHDQPARSLWQLYSELASPTVRRFRRLVASSPLRFETFETVPIRRLRALANPLTREFVTWSVCCSLRRRDVS
jgi:glycosyltransferase involved in cell wall biosynthesis